MAQVDPETHIITVPKTELTLISGTLYSHDTEAFRLQLRDWEDSEIGIVHTKTHNHNTEVTVAGTTYARFITILAPFKVKYEEGFYSVLLTGSNNNIWDVEGGILVQNTVQVIPQNSAGLIVKSVGSGVTPQDIAAIADAVWDEIAAEHVGAGTTGEQLKEILRKAKLAAYKL